MVAMQWRVMEVHSLLGDDRVLSSRDILRDCRQGIRRYVNHNLLVSWHC